MCCYYTFAIRPMLRSPSYIKGGYMIICLVYYILYYILIYLGNNYIIIIKLFYISSVQPTLTILLYNKEARWFLFFDEKLLLG